ncbi:Na+/H+ antiporter subunit D [Longimycelium tulufanense]|uniref:Na+/H+ antiporter subunit D n=1 Tax=Longimycelium tulufanense TaxID=907463 RepID=A0A8J3CEZ2_9PSEU|nr:Na+/H+ antiporter subunit D [Longimycelium tulufanense]GGM50747.1 Na+/H+ antiporter subunit D [Longimycelium tulufanense]
MNVLLAVPVLLPVLAAGSAMVLARFRLTSLLLGPVILLAVLGTAIALLVLADQHGPLVVQVGDWPVPIGITLVADRLSALLLVVSTVVTLAVLLFALGQRVTETRYRVFVPVFHPSYLLLVAGINLAFLAGDLFNLFVAIEMMLAASYVLITLDPTTVRVIAGMTYTVSSLTSSLLFLTAIGLVYAATGTVNLADLSAKLAALPVGLRAALALLLLVVFGIKAAMVPLHFWLPDSYPTAPAPITAVLAALLTKVGVYAMLRTQTLLFPRPDFWPLLLVLALATMAVGIMGAIAQDDINRMLSFILVSHIGFLLLGLALFNVAGLTGAILYMIHHITALAAMFLVSALIVWRAGTSAMREMGGLVRTDPGLAALFSLPAMSLAGLPPLSGFVAKFALLRASVDAAAVLTYTLAVAAVLTSLLTLYALGRAWSRIFWGEPRGASAGREAPDKLKARTWMSSPLLPGATAVLVASGVLVAVLAGPLTGLSQRAAADLANPQQYRSAVLGGERDGGP